MSKVAGRQMCVCKTCGKPAPSHGYPRSILANGWFSWNYCSRECRIADAGDAERRAFWWRYIDTPAAGACDPTGGRDE